VTVAYRATIKSRNQKCNQAAESKIKAPGPDRANLLSIQNNNRNGPTNSEKQRTDRKG